MLPSCILECDTSWDGDVGLRLHIMNLHNKIALSLAELHLLLEGGAKGIERVSSWDGLKSHCVSEMHTE